MENPFIVTGLIKPEYFCDRSEESQRIVKCLTNGENMVFRHSPHFKCTGVYISRSQDAYYVYDELVQLWLK